MAGNLIFFVVMHATWRGPTPLQPPTATKKRGFPGTIGANDSGNGIFRNLQRKIIKGNSSIEILIDVYDTLNRIHIFFPFLVMLGTMEVGIWPD